MSRERAIPVSSFAMLFRISAHALATRQKASVGDHFAPLSHADLARCHSRAGRMRYRHEYDRDGVCLWCDHHEGADGPLS